MVREYDYRSGGWGSIAPKVLLDESFQVNIELMSTQPSMGFEPKTLEAYDTHAYPLSHQGHKETWTRWKYILKVKCEVIKETVSVRKDQRSLPQDLNPRPLTLMVYMLTHWAIRDTRKCKLENTSLWCMCESMMVYVWEYDGVCVRVRWCMCESMMVYVWEYDGVSVCVSV